ncbi:hypothetical protein ACIO13_08260 [Streptomyces sp. NPDC087425]|uniref:hypothetical protein n=1 Tax=Streptomyces sp. NPDC087425 TaxID=3365787 RepID=UPI003828E6DB
MSWMRGPLAVVAACVLLLAGIAGCSSGDGGGSGGGGSNGGNGGRGGGGSAVSPSPAGKVLDGTDKEGRHYREVPEEGAPEVGIEVQPDADDSWNVRLTLRHFRLSPAGTKATAVSGRGFVLLYVDDRLVTRLRETAYRIPARLVPRGTHHVTARLYADDSTAWAAAGEPIESTADITASGTEATGSDGEDAALDTDITASGAEATAPGAAALDTEAAAPDTDVTSQGAVAPAAFGRPGSAGEPPGAEVRTGGRGSPAPAGKAS